MDQDPGQKTRSGPRQGSFADSVLPDTLSEIAADLADLFQKELRLVRAELSFNLAAKLQAGIWISVALVLAGLAALLVTAALVFWIASYGIALHWACLMVGALLLAGAAIASLKARSDAEKSLTPEKSIEQIKQDISRFKEKLT